MTPFERIRAQLMVGESQTVVAKPCAECAWPVYWVERDGWWVIETHNRPNSEESCPRSGEKVQVIK